MLPLQRDPDIKEKHIGTRPMDIELPLIVLETDGSFSEIFDRAPEQVSPLEVQVERGRISVPFPVRTQFDNAELQAAAQPVTRRHPGEDGL